MVKGVDWFNCNLNFSRITTEFSDNIITIVLCAFQTWLVKWCFILALVFRNPCICNFHISCMSAMYYINTAVTSQWRGTGRAGWASRRKQLWSWVSDCNWVTLNNSTSSQAWLGLKLKSGNCVYFCKQNKLIIVLITLTMRLGRAKFWNIVIFTYILVNWG